MRYIYFQDLLALEPAILLTIVIHWFSLMSWEKVMMNSRRKMFFFCSMLTGLFLFQVKYHKSTLLMMDWTIQWSGRRHRGGFNLNWTPPLDGFDFLWSKADHWISLENVWSKSFPYLVYQMLLYFAIYVFWGTQVSLVTYNVRKVCKEGPPEKKTPVTGIFSTRVSVEGSVFLM